MKVLVVDDEPVARRRLIRLLAKINGVEVAGEAANGIQALERIHELEPDVVLLDIRMPGMDGLEVAGKIDGLPQIIFTTAYDEYAVRAFEANAVDYLLKPVQAERLEGALAKISKRTGSKESGELQTLITKLLNREEGGSGPRITARAGKTIRVFDPHLISRFHAADRYTVFQMDGSEFVLDDSLGALEEKLASLGFFRTHRAELINLNLVKTLRLEEGASEVALTDGQTAPVSRRMVPELKKRLGVSE